MTTALISGEPSAPLPYRVLTTDQPEAWRTALPSEACVMGSLEYARIQERHFGHRARLFVTGTDTHWVAYPFFLRATPPHPLLGPHARWDTMTPEYTGPLLMGRTPGPQGAPFLRDFQETFTQYCHSEGIVAEFAHLSPWNPGSALLDPACIEVNREIVYIDLTWGEARLWKESLSSDARRATRQAIKAGVRVYAARTPEDVLAFHHLHQKTMERRAAEERYYLSPDYFLSIFATMADNAMFMLAEFDGQVVAGGLYFQDATDVYWHLSAVDLDFSPVRPVNAYHYETILLAARAGKQRLLCGGAFHTGDGVFRFKAGFSRLRTPFQVLKRIHDPEAYAALAEAWASSHPGAQPVPGFFPTYRSAALESAAAGEVPPACANRP